MFHSTKQFSFVQSSQLHTSCFFQLWLSLPSEFHTPHESSAVVACFLKLDWVVAQLFFINTKQLVFRSRKTPNSGCRHLHTQPEGELHRRRLHVRPGLSQICQQDAARADSRGGTAGATAGDP